MNARAMIVMLLLGGTRFPLLPALAGEPLSAAFPSLYRAANEQFLQADFYKPGGTNTGDLVFGLAPLILQQVDASGDSVSDDRFGAVGVSNGVLRIDLSRPTIYVHLDTMTLRGEAHPQLSYLWFYPSNSAASNQLVCQGVRLTLNSSGQPVIWEILGKTSSAALIFASESLEAAAQARFGPPLPGRKYGIEPASNEEPVVVVPRIIDDGPVPMGPIVYLRAATRSVLTVICRCMPAQAKTLRGSFNYELLPLETITAPLLTRLKQRSENQLAFWPTYAQSAPVSLERKLRLPAHF